MDDLPDEIPLQLIGRLSPSCHGDYEEEDPLRDCSGGPGPSSSSSSVPNKDKYYHESSEESDPEVKVEVDLDLLDIAKSEPESVSSDTDTTDDDKSEQFPPPRKYRKSKKIEPKPTKPKKDHHGRKPSVGQKTPEEKRENARKRYLEQKDEIRKKYKEKWNSLTQEQKEEQRKIQKLKRLEKRSSLTAEQKEEQKKKCWLDRKEKLVSLTEEEKEQERKKRRLRDLRKREKMTEEERQERRQKLAIKHQERKARLADELKRKAEEQKRKRDVEFGGFFSKMKPEQRLEFTRKTAEKRIKHPEKIKALAKTFMRTLKSRETRRKAKEKEILQRKIDNGVEEEESASVPEVEVKIELEQVSSDSDDDNGVGDDDATTTNSNGFGENNLRRSSRRIPSPKPKKVKTFSNPEYLILPPPPKKTRVHKKMEESNDDNDDDDDGAVVPKKIKNESDPNNPDPDCSSPPKKRKKRKKMSAALAAALQRKGHKSKMDKMTPEEYRAHLDKIKEKRHLRRPPKPKKEKIPPPPPPPPRIPKTEEEKKENRKIKQNLRSREKWRSLTEEQKQEQRRKVNLKRQEKLKKMTEEELREYRQKCTLKTLDHMVRFGEDVVKKKKNEYMRNRWANLTPEQKQNRRHYSTLTEEQKQRRRDQNKAALKRKNERREKLIETKEDVQRRIENGEEIPEEMQALYLQMLQEETETGGNVRQKQKKKLLSQKTDPDLVMMQRVKKKLKEKTELEEMMAKGVPLNEALYKSKFKTEEDRMKYLMRYRAGPQRRKLKKELQEAGEDPEVIKKKLKEFVYVPRRKCGRAYKPRKEFVEYFLFSEKEKAMLQRMNEEGIINSEGIIIEGGTTSSTSSISVPPKEKEIDSSSIVFTPVPVNKETENSTATTVTTVEEANNISVTVIPTPPAPKDDVSSHSPLSVYNDCDNDASPSSPPRSPLNEDCESGGNDNDEDSLHQPPSPSYSIGEDLPPVSLIGGDNIAIASLPSTSTSRSASLTLLGSIPPSPPNSFPFPKRIVNDANANDRTTAVAAAITENATVAVAAISIIPPPPTPPVSEHHYGYCHNQTKAADWELKPVGGAANRLTTGKFKGGVPRGPNPNRQSDNSNSVICEDCGFSYTKNSIQRHRETIHNPLYKDSTCQVCGLKFTRGSTWLQHYTQKHVRSADDDDNDINAGRRKRRTFAELHKAGLLSGVNLENYLKKKASSDSSTKGLSICGKCGVTFSNSQQLKLHEVTDHNLNFRNGLCLLCPDIKEKFKRRYDYYLHYTQVHGRGGGTGTETASTSTSATAAAAAPTLICSKCGKTFLKMHSLNIHMTKAHKIKEHNVMEEPRQSKLTPPRNSKFNASHLCGLCSKVVTKKEMDAHVKENHPESYFPCVFCNIPRFSELSLRYHETRCESRDNEKVKELREEWRAKGGIFVASLELKCEFCEAECKLVGLDGHYRKVHKLKEDKMNECEICKMTFKMRMLYVLHMESVHKWKVEDALEKCRYALVERKEGMEVHNREGKTKDGRKMKESGRRGRGRPRLARRKIKDEDEKEVSSEEEEAFTTPSPSSPPNISTRNGNGRPKRNSARKAKGRIKKFNRKLSKGDCDDEDDSSSNDDNNSSSGSDSDLDEISFNVKMEPPSPPPSPSPTQPPPILKECSVLLERLDPLILYNKNTICQK